MKNTVEITHWQVIVTEITEVDVGVYILVIVDRFQGQRHDRTRCLVAEIRKINLVEITSHINYKEEELETEILPTHA